MTGEFRNETERRQYEYCRDVMFPTLAEMKRRASSRVAAKVAADAQRKSERQAEVKR